MYNCITDSQYTEGISSFTFIACSYSGMKLQSWPQSWPIQISYDALGGGGCSNRQSTDIWGVAKSSYNCYGGWKSLIYSSSCSI